MSSRITSVISQCTNKPISETDSSTMYDATDDEPSVDDVKGTSQPPQSGFLWRITSGAVGGVYNVATGAAGMGYNTTKWVVNKGVEVGSNVVGSTKDVSVSALSKTAAAGSAVYNKLPVPALVKRKDKKE